MYVWNMSVLWREPGGFCVEVGERYPHAVLTSTIPPSGVPTAGVENLQAVLRTAAQALRPIAQIRVPLGDGKLRATIHRDAEVLGEVQTDGVVVVTARVEARLLGRLRQEGIEVSLGGGS